MSRTVALNVRVSISVEYLRGTPNFVHRKVPQAWLDETAAGYDLTWDELKDYAWPYFEEGAHVEGDAPSEEPPQGQ